MVDVALVVGTVGIDSIAVPFLRGNTDVGVQLGLMDAESFAVSSVVVISLYDTVGRARPSYEDCQRNPNFDADCRVSPTASFPSGHVNEAFTVAGLSCAQHTHLSLYGSRLLDVLACARDVALATTDGVLRIMGDRHYATDVLAGGALGFAWGYGLPMLLHYGRRDGSPSPTWSLAPLAGGGAHGARPRRDPLSPFAQKTIPVSPTPAPWLTTIGVGKTIMLLPTVARGACPCRCMM